jgi:hypothetical protein
LNESAGYTPTSVLVIDTLYVGGTTTQVYVSSTSSSGAAIISAFSFDHSKQTLTSLGAPFTLKGNAQPTELVLGPSPAYPPTPPSSYWVLANDGSASVGSKISVLLATVGGAPTLTEASGSPFTVTGLDGASIQVQDITTADYNGTSGSGQPLAGNLLYTANSDNSISGFVIGSTGALTPAPGSPWADPDSPAGTHGNPTSLAFDPYQGEVFGLDSGSSSLSLWKLNTDNGVLTYQNAQQAGLIKSVAGDKLRDIQDIPVDCLITSSGYGVEVDYGSGTTTLLPGSPVLNAEGRHPSVALAFW